MRVQFSQNDPPIWPLLLYNVCRFFTFFSCSSLCTPIARLAIPTPAIIPILPDSLSLLPPTHPPLLLLTCLIFHFPKLLFHPLFTTPTISPSTVITIVGVAITQKKASE